MDDADLAQEIIDERLADEIRRCRVRLTGESATRCDECGRLIPEARRKAVPGVRRCVRCQAAAEA